MKPDSRNRTTIRFFTEGITYSVKGIRELRTWINMIILKEGYQPGEINIIFCADHYLLDINIKYLKHNTLTDIVTFDLSELKSTVQGDIYISIERARENARTYKVRLREEIKRLIAHGILHLTGYGDKSPEQKKTMTLKENFYLSLSPR